MILISHRGNINGKNVEKENSPIYILDAIKNGYNVEVDIWLIDNKLYLGHDEPNYEININYVFDIKDKLWIHCKNIDSLLYFSDIKNNINFFWHQSDDVTLTNKNYLWTYPGKVLTEKSIAVLPEQTEYSVQDLANCYGICSDYIKRYNK